MSWVLSSKAQVKRTIGPRRYRRIKATLTRFQAHRGLTERTRPGLNGLDTRLIEAIKPHEGGTFVEFGANDGIQQSNTFALEAEFGWRGVLVEPIPQLAAECVRNRPKAQVICAGVTSGPLVGAPLFLEDSDLTSSLGGHSTAASIGVGIELPLNLANPSGPVDLLVVDVEGHELAALDSLSRVAYQPKWILVETSDLDAVRRVLPHYSSAVALSYHDYLLGDVTA